MIYDWRTREILKEISIKGDALGYNVRYTKKGGFLVLQEKTYTNNIKKAKLSNFIVVDLSTYKAIHYYKKIEDLEFLPDDQEFITLQDGVLFRRNAKTGEVKAKVEFEHARNAIAISPDGQHIAIVSEPTAEKLQEVASVRNDKKAIKNALKYRHMISVYNIASQELETHISDVYDNINTMEYTPSGSKLLNFNAGLNSYINVIESGSYEPQRESYGSRTNVQPDYSYNDDESLFGLASVEDFPTVNIYEGGSGKMLDSYNTKNRIFKSMKKKMYPGTYSSFVFLPEDDHVLIAYGNALIKWKVEK